MSDLYDLILFGKLKDEADPAEVKVRLAKVLKIDEAKAEALISSGRNTRLFRALTKDQADKYYRVIASTGVTCNVAPSAGKSLSEMAAEHAAAQGGASTGNTGAGSSTGAADGLSLIPMSEGTRVFKCPSCGHEEEMSAAALADLEKCPACKQDIKKLLAAQEAEQTEARLRSNKAAAERRQLKSYEDRLRIELEKQIRARLEEEIRRELGIGQGDTAGFWGFFMRNRAAMVIGVFGSLVGITVDLTLVIKSFLDEQEREEIAAAPPTPEMEAVAPAVAAAVTASIQSEQVEQNVQVMAETVNAMAPPAQQVDMQAMATAGMTMMKGLDPGAFMAMAATTQMMGQAMGPLAAMGGLPVGGGSSGRAGMAGMTGGAPPMMMGMPGVANQLGMPGMGQIPKEDFVAMMSGMASPGMGQMAVMGMVSGNPVLQGQLPMVDGVEAPRIDALTPIEAGTIVGALIDDREWGRFLATRAGEIARENPDAASALASRIQSPYERAAARARIAVALQETGFDAAARQMSARALDELNDLEDVDARAQAAVALGVLLNGSGQQAVPADVRARLQGAADRSIIAEDKAALLGRVAVSHYISGNLDAANERIEAAVKAAGTLQNDVLRLQTFLRIAQRYGDMSATPVAHTIVNEAVSRATDLPTEDRVRVFVETAKARAYLGDTERAARDLNLVGEEVARDQALTTVVEHLILANEPYRAAQFIDGLTDQIAASQADLDLVSQMLSESPAPIVMQRMDLAQQRLPTLEDPETRALMYSRLARLQIRAGRPEDAERNFQIALEGARIARLESRDLMHSTIAIDQAFALDIDAARITLERIAVPILRDRVADVLSGIAEILTTTGLADPMYFTPAQEQAPDTLDSRAR